MISVLIQKRLRHTEGRPCENIGRRQPSTSKREYSEETKPAHTLVSDVQPPEH